jgi:hypothetical protein
MKEETDKKQKNLITMISGGFAIVVSNNIDRK